MKLTPKEALAYLKREYGLEYAERTLANFRAASCEGTGPKYYRPSPSRVVYDTADLDAWAREKLGQPAANALEERTTLGRTFPGAPDNRFGRSAT